MNQLNRDNEVNGKNCNVYGKAKRYIYRPQPTEFPKDQIPASNIHKKRWISTMERTAQLIINKKRNQFTPQEEKIQTQTIIKTDSECQFVFNKLWPDWHKLALKTTNQLVPVLGYWYRADPTGRSTANRCFFTVNEKRSQTRAKNDKNSYGWTTQKHRYLRENKIALARG